MKKKGGSYQEKGFLVRQHSEGKGVSYQDKGFLVRQQCRRKGFLSRERVSSQKGFLVRQHNAEERGSNVLFN